MPHGEWVGFVYGWDGATWKRSDYDEEDGFNAVDLVGACSLESFDTLRNHALDAPGLNGQPPSDEALGALILADADITQALLAQVVPGWDIDAGVAAAKKFLQMDV